jgi:hypothetical protein
MTDAHVPPAPEPDADLSPAERWLRALLVQAPALADWQRTRLSALLDPGPPPGDYGIT